jgi:hypothetical protein
MAIDPPPIYEPLIEQNGSARIPWILFFNNIFQGDGGTDWNPTFVSLGSTGTPTITGRYYKIGQNLVWFSIRITPATDTTSTAATTYCDNFPLAFRQDSVCLASSGSGAVQAIGGIRAADNRIYPPGWAGVTQPLTIVGFGEAR